MSIKISFTGDIMCKKEILEQYLGSKDFSFSEIFQPVKSLLSKSDFVIGNLETPIAGNELEYTKGKYNFNSPIEFAKSVKGAGVHYVSTANNHCLDRGIEGIIKTNENLDKIGILHSGTNSSPEFPKSDIYAIGKLKLGILSYTCTTEVAANNIRLTKEQLWYVNLGQEQALNNIFLRSLYYSKFQILRKTYKALSILLGQRNRGNPDDRRENSRRCKREILREIKKLRENGADIIIMNLHAGGQYNLNPEKRVLKYAEWLHRHDVEAVVINHEHLVQVADFSKLKSINQFTAYCLGNFLGGAGLYYPPYDKMVEYSVLLHMYVEEESRKIDCSFSILKMVNISDHRYQVVPVFDLINNTKDVNIQNKLKDDNLKIYNRFLGMNKKHIEPQEEYKCQI